jgi:protein-disulfide isomerase
MPILRKIASGKIARLCLAAALGASAAAHAQSAKLDDVVAKIDGRAVTRSELYGRESGTLLQQRYDNYHVEREALGTLIDDELIAAEARRRGITVQQLTQQEIDSKVQDPTEQELLVFYEGVQTDKTYESLHGQLLARVHQTRAKRFREAFLTSLRTKAKIQVLLPPPVAETALDDAPSRGPKNAPVVLVEFADFECPFCRQMQPEIEQLLKEYDGKLTLYYKEFPLNIHPHAEKAAEAARCAGDQGAFWPYHDILFGDRSSLEIPQLKESARTLKLDGARFDACLDSGQQVPAIQKDLAQGQLLGLAGTPGFFINGHFLSGVVSYETLREVVEQQLNPVKAAN